jgi:hypothetical protein
MTYLEKVERMAKRMHKWYTGQEYGDCPGVFNCEVYKAAFQEAKEILKEIGVRQDKVKKDRVRQGKG